MGRHMMGTRTRGAATHAVALAGTLLLGGAMMLDAASAHAGATRVPAFKNGTGWTCDGVPPAGSTPPAGAAVIGLAGSAQNPVVHGTAQMRGLLPNTTYTLRLYNSNGSACS